MERLKAHQRRTDPPSRDQAIGGRFLVDPRMERLIELRAADPAAFDEAVTGGLRIALAHYEAAKAAHDRLAEEST